MSTRCKFFKPVRVVALPALAFGLLMGTGCAGYGGTGPIVTHMAVIYADRAPPPRRYVVIPARPAANAVWVDGYWDWIGFQFVWVDGYWELSPPAGHIWTPARWERTYRGWRRVPGYWAPRRSRRGSNHPD